jgi:hypothetical protein
MPWVPHEAWERGPGMNDEQSGTYLCDWPGCENPAQHVLGCVKELGARLAVCTEHVSGARPSQRAVDPWQQSSRPWENS